MGTIIRDYRDDYRVSCNLIRVYDGLWSTIVGDYRDYGDQLPSLSPSAQALNS